MEDCPNEAHNFVATILPFQTNDYKSCCVSLRLKNHYAPEEIKNLQKVGYHIPTQNPIYYLYNWKRSQFTVYNCFELADIKHRSIFRSELDFLIACSWNKDVYYFMDIIESITRDIHCYVIYSNTSQFGCSRVLQPKKHELRNIAQIGGGKNCTLLVAELDIKSLATFQTHGYDSEDDSFKPLPPGFDRENVIRRHKHQFNL
jgi:hypothetical protein